MDEQQQRIGAAWVGAGYAYAQLAKAFVTSLTDRDPQVRERAEGRLRRWDQVLSGIVTGRLTVGSRRPVGDWPVWVTPGVVRGGFATGIPVAAGPLTADEQAWAQSAGLPLRRDALFAYFLTEDGLAELAGLLESGHYRVRVPEEAALLTVAWLVGAGDQSGAQRVVEEIRPFADRLRFVPARTTGAVRGTEVVWRETADTSGTRCAARAATCGSRRCGKRSGCGRRSRTRCSRSGWRPDRTDGLPRCSRGDGGVSRH
jgi:hypothetical protein